jgi:hypothetical protein
MNLWWFPQEDLAHTGSKPNTQHNISDTVLSMCSVRESKYAVKMALEKAQQEGDVLYSIIEQLVWRTQQAERVTKLGLYFFIQSNNTSSWSRK